VSGRNVTVKARNRYIRYVCAYVQYLDANGDALGDSSFVADLPTNNTIFGIPLMGDLVQDISMPVTLPDTASQAKLIFGAPGMGGQAFDTEAFNASIFTCVFNLGIPVILLGVGIGVESSSTITSILKDEDVKTALYAFGAFQYASFQAAKYTYTRGAQSLIAAISDKVVSLIWSNAALRKKIEEIMVEQELEGAIPFVGWVLRALSVAGTLATLGETTGEVLSSPAIFNNIISLTMTTTVTVYPDPTGLEDPSKAKFPGVASYYVVTLSYDGKPQADTTGSGSVRSQVTRRKAPGAQDRRLVGGAHGLLEARPRSSLHAPLALEPGGVAHRLAVDDAEIGVGRLALAGKTACRAFRERGVVRQIEHRNRILQQRAIVEIDAPRGREPIGDLVDTFVARHTGVAADVVPGDAPDAAALIHQVG
jgi:hypothetical protein